MIAPDPEASYSAPLEHEGIDKYPYGSSNSLRLSDKQEIQTGGKVHYKNLSIRLYQNIFG